jgi:hypothetical protein
MEMRPSGSGPVEVPSGYVEDTVACLVGDGDGDGDGDGHGGPNEGVVGG